jgi:hypothetical protein
MLDRPLTVRPEVRLKPNLFSRFINPIQRYHTMQIKLGVKERKEFRKHRFNSMKWCRSGSCLSSKGAERWDGFNAKSARWGDLEREDAL